MPKMTANEKKVCGMYKKSRVELRCALMTFRSESKVCGMY